MQARQNSATLPALKIVSGVHMPEVEWVSTGEAAKLLNTSRETIVNMIKRGDIPAEKTPFGSRFIYRIRTSDLEGVEIKPGGRPKKEY